jgi:predicted transcriptional regulator
MDKSGPDPPLEDEFEVDAKTLAAINLGIRAGEEGRVVPSEDVPRLVDQWLSKFATQYPR